MKGLIILANGFEDVEAIATIDILRRSKLVLDLVSVNDTLDVLSQSNIRMKTEKLINEVSESDYDFLVIPGGKAVRLELDKNDDVANLIKKFVKAKKLIATICAAPSLVGKHGFFNNQPFTCFPGYETTSQGGKYQMDKTVIKNEQFITGKSMAYSIDFALEIIEHLQGKDQRNIINKSIRGEL